MNFCFLVSKELGEVTQAFGQDALWLPLFGFFQVHPRGMSPCGEPEQEKAPGFPTEPQKIKRVAGEKRVPYECPMSKG